jgi:hypothetical protein
MATILEFRAQTGKPSAAREQTRPGEVVIFPGVRYERWSEARPVRSRKRTRQRDRLEIEE